MKKMCFIKNYFRVFERAQWTRAFTRILVATGEPASPPTADLSATATTSTSTESSARKVSQSNK